MTRRHFSLRFITFWALLVFFVYWLPSDSETLGHGTVLLEPRYVPAYKLEDVTVQV